MGYTSLVKEYAEKYPDIIKPIIQTENQYSKHNNFGFILEKCFCKVKGKYIAYFEGDDFWIDHFKLQKQVDFLESLSILRVYNFCNKSRLLLLITFAGIPILMVHGEVDLLTKLIAPITEPSAIIMLGNTMQLAPICE